MHSTATLCGNDTVEERATRTALSVTGVPACGFCGVIPTDSIAQSVSAMAGGGNVGVLDIMVAGGNVGRIIEWNVIIVKWNVVVGGGSVGRIIEWNVGSAVKVNCGEDSGAKCPEVLTVAAIVTVNRRKSIAATQERTFILPQPDTQCGSKQVSPLQKAGV